MSNTKKLDSNFLTTFCVYYRPDIVRTRILEGNFFLLPNYVMLYTVGKEI